VTIELDTNVGSVSGGAVAGAGPTGERPASGLPIGSPSKPGNRVTASGVLSVDSEDGTVRFIPDNPAAFVAVIEADDGLPH
jgi:hypothetical protein